MKTLHGYEETCFWELAYLSCDYFVHLGRDCVRDNYSEVSLDKATRAGFYFDVLHPEGGVHFQGNIWASLL